MTSHMPQAYPATDASPDEATMMTERAYLRRRAFQERGLAIDASDPSVRLPHDQMARAYCMRCRAIRDQAECAVCALQPLCQGIADQARE